MKKINNCSAMLCISIIISFFISIQQLYGQSNYIYDEQQLPYSSPYYEQEDTFIGSSDSRGMEIIANNPIRKLGRGFSNVLFGILEIFIQPYKINETEGGIAALSYGLFKGIFYFIGREVVGVIDIITFPMPLPGASNSKYDSVSWGYGPLIEPEWIFTIEDNPYNFIYPNYSVD